VPLRALGAVSVLLSATAAWGATSDAPMQLGTDGTFGALFLQMTSGDARALEGPEFDARWSIANDWSIPTTLVRGKEQVLLQNDEQADSIAFTVRTPWSLFLGPGSGKAPRPLWERFSTALEWRIVEHWGGWTDRPIEAWHTLIQALNFERAQYPRNAVNVSLVDLTTGRGLDIHSPRFAVGDLVLRTQFLVAEGGSSAVGASRSRWGLSARLDVKAPTGGPEDLGGSGGWDAGGAILGTVELTRWLTLHGMAALSVFSPLALPEPLQPQTWHYAGEASLVARFGDVSVLLEDRFDSALFQGGWERVPMNGDVGFLSSGYYGAFRPQNQISGGVRWNHFTFWFSEDFTPGSSPYQPQHWFYSSNTPDVEIGLAYSAPL